MKIIVVDDERRNLNMMEKALARVAPDAEVGVFSSAMCALAYAREHRVDVAFLDIRMPEMDGLTLARYMKEIYGSTNVVFVTGYSQYAFDAFDMHASGYLMKPITPERVKRELDNLRDPVSPHRDERVRVQCFGGFAVFVDGRPMLFPRAKTKELLAYLVHKQGAVVTNAEIASVLWEDRNLSLSLQSNTRNVISQLMRELKEAGAGEIVRRARNSTAIDAEKISCDYYDFLRGKMDAVNAYMGEYMSDYSWAEFTVAYLNDKIRNTFAP